MPNAPEISEGFGRALADVGAGTLTGLQALEAALRRLNPPQIATLREQLRPVQERLAAGIESFRGQVVPDGLEPFHAELLSAANLTRDALASFIEQAPGEAPAAGILASMSLHARAQEALYPLRVALPPLAHYFVEPPLYARLAELDPEGGAEHRVGLHRATPPGGGERGGFHLYVPETYTPDRDWPLVVALHGGSGNGRDFLWTWLREARSRGALLLAPTSRESTWALSHPADETPALAEMVEHVCSGWNVDRGRVLLTGLSDGATFSLLAGLAEAAPYTALAPVSGVLHPDNAALGNLARAAGRRIYLVHGALDWMFPVALARAARDTLLDAGAELTYRELEDLSHTYPRDENARILRWFDPSLALPGEGDA
jgi:phospholipase/carboxylesterase